MKKIDAKLIMGLGNPTPRYHLTYHNIGKLCGEYLLKRTTGNSYKNRKPVASTSDFTAYRINNFLLIEPLAFMNESGRALKPALKYFGFKINNALIIHDDSDIELGQYKVSFGSGSAGHKGVESIIKLFGTKDFWRLRIGIRRMHRKRKKAGEIVLQKITSQDMNIFKKLFRELSKTLIL